MRPKLSPELQEDTRQTQRANRDEIVRKAYEPARVHPMEAAEREPVRQEAEDWPGTARTLLVRCEGVLSISKGSTQHHENVRRDLLQDIRRELGMPEGD